MNSFLQVVKAVLLLATGLLTTAHGQDIHFAQFYENTSMRNPALTGIFSGDYKAGCNYRSQWNTISAPYQTLLATAEMRSRINREHNDYLSYGLTFLYDKAAAISFNTMQALATVNYNKHLEDAHGSYLSAGFGGAFIQRSFDPGRVTTNSQYIAGNFDPAAATGENFTETRLRQFDLSAGVSFNSSLGHDNRLNYYVGMAGFHLLRPKESFMQQAYSRLTAKYTGQLGGAFLVNERLAFTMHLNYLNQHPYQEWIGGGMATYFHRPEHPSRERVALSAGIYYRLRDALIPTFRLDYRRLSLTTSYDITTSSLRRAGGNALEVSLYLRGRLPRRASYTEQLVCPRFEIGNNALEEAPY